MTLKTEQKHMTLQFEITPTPTVKLLLITTREKIISNMFKVVYKLSNNIENVLEKIETDSELDENDIKLIKKIIKRKHTSVLEFIDTLWYIECSRVTSHQLVRHRIASYWQESHRYVKANKFILPRSLLSNEEIVKLIRDCYDHYRLLTEYCKDFGEDSKEMFRYVLPCAVASRIFVKMNLRELYEVFIPLRSCKRAQAEIRYIAIKMILELKKKLNIISKYLGARCILYKYCPEYNINDELIMKRCREKGYKEAILEHGTDKEIENIENIIKQLP